MISVVVSGYFTVIHKGHVELFKKAATLGDVLFVIINNDEQQIAKKGKLIMPAEDIKQIIEEFECVGAAFISFDEDSTVCKSLQALEPDIFANGGDRKEDNIPEYKICNENNIEMVFNLGDKVESSSNVLKRLEK